MGANEAAGLYGFSESKEVRKAFIRGWRRRISQDSVSLSREVTASKQGSGHGSIVGGPEPAERGRISVMGAAVGPCWGAVEPQRSEEGTHA